MWQSVGKLENHRAVSFSSRFTAPRWMVTWPAPCPGPVVALSPPPQAPHPLLHSSAWLPWAVVLPQRSGDVGDGGDGDDHAGQRLRAGLGPAEPQYQHFYIPSQSALLAQNGTSSLPRNLAATLQDIETKRQLALQQKGKWP